MSALPLTIKDKSLWKRLIIEYAIEDLVKMIDRWMVTSKMPSSFTAFYMNRHDLYDVTREKNYEWD